MPVTVRARQAALLLTPLIRAVPGPPLLAAVALAATGMLPALLGAAAPAAQVWGLRIAAVLLGAGASFAMVDSMAPVTITATPRWLRQWLRFAIVAVPVALVWAGLCLLTVATMPPDRPPLPVAGLAIEAAVCALSGLTGAAVASRTGASATTALTGPTFQAALLVATLFLPARWSPWTLPGAASWPGVHAGWSAALPVLVLALLVANRSVTRSWPSDRGS